MRSGILKQGWLSGLLFLLLLACGRQGPAEVARTYHSHMATGNTEKALAMIPKEVIGAFGEEKLTAALLRNKQKIDARGGITSIETTQEEVEGNFAKVTLTIEYGNGDKEPESYELVRIDGAWKFAMTSD